MGLLNILANNNKGIDPQDAESKIRNDHPLLLGPNEHVELAFKGSADARDKNYFTSHRILVRDVPSLISSKRKKFKSIPYQSIKAFAVQTAGSFDSNTELIVWYDGGTKVINFAKDSVDLFEVQQFFNHKVFAQQQSSNSLTTNNTNLQGYSTTSNYVQQATNVESVFNWLGSDAVQVDPKAIQDRFGFGSPSPVLMPHEQVEIAYQCRRDVIIITPTRFLLVDVKGISGKQIEFFSLRWQCVKAFSVETAGNFDRDGDFVVYTSIPGKYQIRHDLRKGKTDMFQLNMAFSNKILGGASGDKIQNVNTYQGHVDPGAALFGGGNARPLDRQVVENKFRSNPCLLQSDESVEMAFQGRRDLVIFTTKRILDVDVKGFSGKKVKYSSIPYSSILAFQVNTAGKHDRDSEVCVYTEIRYNVPPHAEEPDPGMSYLEWDFNKNVVDILSLKRYLTARLLSAEKGRSVPVGLLKAAPKDKGVDKLLSTLGEDQRQIDAQELDSYLRVTMDLLCDDENVVMAFKAGRDISCFTNKRIFILDRKGWSGKKVAYQSIPYSSIKAFSAESAGSWDRDSTVRIYTKNYWTLSTLYLDFRKGKADIVAIQNFLSAIVLGSERDAANYLKTVNSGTIRQNHPKGMNGFTDFLIDVSVEVDPRVTESQLKSDPPILLDDERVEKVYREGRDLWVYTNLRILKADVRGISGSKVLYLTIPFNRNSVTAFAVETCGTIDIDAECYMYTNIPDARKLMMKVLVKSGNIFDMHKYLSDRMLFDKSTASSSSAAQTQPALVHATQAIAPSAAIGYNSYGNTAASSNNDTVSGSNYDPYAKYDSAPSATAAASGNTVSHDPYSNNDNGARLKPYV